VRLLAAAALLALAAPLVASASTPRARLYFEDSIPSGTASSVTVTTHRPASFRVLLRVPTTGRAKLYLLGRHAPMGGPLIHTSNTSANSSGCQGAAGSFYCKASYEPLPRGTYTWRITWKGTPPAAAHVELTLRW
jgi:hypothetical protein